MVKAYVLGNYEIYAEKHVLDELKTISYVKEAMVSRPRMTLFYKTTSSLLYRMMYMFIH